MIGRAMGINGADSAESERSGKDRDGTKPKVASHQYQVRFPAPGSDSKRSPEPEVMSPVPSHLDDESHPCSAKPARANHGD